MNDLAAAITQSLSKDGQTVPTANLPMGGFRHTGVGDPVLRDNYASLGWVQDGKHTRLTGVAGVNAITATLPGGASAFTVGQIVQLIPTSTNTSAVTLNVNGIPLGGGNPNVPIVTDIGSALAAGNLIAGRTYLLSFTGATWQIISASGGVAGFAQAAMTGWDRPISGIYPSITLVNPTTVFVPGGTGRIVKPSARDLSGVREVTWAGQNVTIENVAVDWTTTLAVNSNGQIIQLTGNFSPNWARDYIMLGTVAHLNGQINEITTQPTIYGDMTYAAYDTAYLLNNTLVSGGKVLPNAASPFHIDIQAGIIFSLGRDSIDLNGPNTGNFPAVFDLSFFPITGTSGISAATQNVPVTQYDPLGAGVITAIPGGATTATIHRLFLVAGEYVLLYGQAAYADLISALSQLSVDDASLVYPAKLVNATMLCYIAVQKNCTDLKNTATARIVAKGGTNFSIGTAGSISEAPINGLLYGRVNAAWAETVPAPVGPQATLRQIYYYTNTFARWSEGADDIAEGGANTGSNWVLRRYTDAGGLLGTVMEIDRATGAVFIDGPVSVQDTIFMDTSLGQSLSVYGIGAGLPINGAAPGIRAANYDTSAGVNIALSFSHTDSAGAERHAAGVVCGKEGPWTGGSGLYPAYLSFYTRVSGGTQQESFRVNSNGSVTFNFGTTFTGAAIFNGTATFNGAFSIPAGLTGPVTISGASPVFTVVPVSNAAEARIRAGDFSATVGLSNLSNVESVGARNDANATFGGRFGAGFRRTDGIAIANGHTTGIMAFGGQWGTGTSWNQTQFLYAASVCGVAEGNFTSAVAMPMGLSFRTGSTGDRLDGVNLNYGIERLRISSTGQATFTNTITAAQDFISSTTTAILATTGAGSIALRPNGAGSAAGQMSLAATGNATFFGPTSVIVKAQGQGGFGAHESNSSGANDAYHFFSNATTGELVRLVGSANTFAIQTGAAPVQRAAFTNNGITFNQHLIMTPAVLTVSPMSITGAFTGVGRQLIMTNSDTSTGSLFGWIVKAGSSLGTTISDYATEYTGLVAFTGRFAIENSNVAGGLVFSALGATGTHTWLQGAARTQMMILGSAGLSLATATGIGFYGTAAQTKQTVTGSRAGNAALTSLLTALATYGLITNSSSA